jgi:DNA replication protein DnaC
VSTLKSNRARQAPFCVRCSGVHALVERSGEYARAVRCPACSATCPECDGSGYQYFTDELGQMLYRECVCRQLDRRIQLFNRSGIPARYSAATLENFERKHEAKLENVVATVLRFIKEYQTGGRGLGLVGEPGCGKTHLMVATVRELTLRHGIEARFIEFSHLLTELKRGFDDGVSDASQLLSLSAVPVLVIDEMGKDLSTTWQVGILDELVSRRYNAGATTCFTSNYPFAVTRAPKSAEREAIKSVSLEQRVGSRVFSRLVDMCELITVDAPDFRKRRGIVPGPT